MTTIRLNQETKEKLGKFKQEDNESYDSMFQRLIPSWAEVVLKVKHEREAEASSLQKQYGKTDPNI